MKPGVLKWGGGGMGKICKKALPIDGRNRQNCTIWALAIVLMPYPLMATLLSL